MMRHSFGRQQRLAVLLLSVGLLLVGSPVVVAQEDGSDRSQEMSPPADDAPPPAEATSPSGGPGTDQPWWQWDMQVSPAKQFAGQFLYQHFWDLRIESLGAPGIEAELNLRYVMGGQALKDEVDFLHTLEAKGQAQVVRVQQQPTVVWADDDNYVILDTYLDGSYLVDAKTRAPVGEGPPAEAHAVNMAYHMVKVPNQLLPDSPDWKIVDSIAINYVSSGSGQ